MFLSYASEDAETARRLRPLLKLAGFGPSLDSQSLSTAESLETASEKAIAASDFVVALISRSTRTSRQTQELRAAVGRPLILPCATTSIAGSTFYDIVPDELRQSHVMTFADFEVGWARLYESLYKAARVAGFQLPRFLRAVPKHDLDRSAVARIIHEKGFFSRTMNAAGGSEEAQLTLAPGGLTVDDASSGRVWTRGCVNPSSPPKAPLSSADEEVASLTPALQRSETQRTLVAERMNLKRRTKLAIEEMVALFNVQRYAGYDDWRLPTVEEAMFLMTRNIRTGGVHISDLFSDHEYIRTADGSTGPQLLGQEPGWAESVWVVGYSDADCLEVTVEAPIPLRFVRTDLD